MSAVHPRDAQELSLGEAEPAEEPLAITVEGWVAQSRHIVGTPSGRWFCIEHDGSPAPIVFRRREDAARYAASQPVSGYEERVVRARVTVRVDVLPADAAEVARG